MIILNIYLYMCLQTSQLLLWYLQKYCMQMRFPDKEYDLLDICFGQRLEDHKLKLFILEDFSLRC